MLTNDNAQSPKPANATANNAGTLRIEQSNVFNIKEKATLTPN